MKRTRAHVKHEGPAITIFTEEEPAPKKAKPEPESEAIPHADPERGLAGVKPKSRRTWQPVELGVIRQ